MLDNSCKAGRSTGNTRSACIPSELEHQEDQLGSQHAFQLKETLFPSFFPPFLSSLLSSCCTLVPTHIHKNLVIFRKMKYVFNHCGTDYLKTLNTLKLKQKLGKTTTKLTSRNERNQLKKCKWSQLNPQNCYGKQKKQF